MTSWPVLAIVPAAGSGTRMGLATPKQFLPLAGVPVLLRTLSAVASHPDIVEVCLAVAGGEVGRARALVSEARLSVPLQVVEGGATRQETVRLALAAYADRLDRFRRVLVHDAARPLLSHALLDRAIAASREHGAVVCAVQLRDTVKRADARRRVAETLPREELWAAQTPQLFDPDWLCAAHAAAAGQSATDDAAVIERAGRPVHIVEGDPENLKLTTPTDFKLAEALLAAKRPATRTGFGYDVHRLEAGRRLVLGGVEIPFSLGLAGHSDADVLLHAIMDALLGAAALGDIGQLFPNDDPAYRGASSERLLAEVCRRVGEAGLAPVHVDATVVAEAPRLAPHVPEMRERIGRLLGLPPERVSVKATTNEGLGAIGEGRGIAAYAVATVVDKAG